MLFNSLTFILNREHFPTARQVTRNPLSYCFSPLVTKASVMILLTRFTGRSFVTEIPPMSPQSFGIINWARDGGVFSYMV